MLQRLVALCLDRKLTAFLLAAVLGVVGWMAFRDITVEAFPDPTDPQVQVITLFPGQPSEEVERRIALPLERALNGTPGLIRLRSISIFALSLTTLTFGDGVDVMQARTQVTERLAAADLPAGVTPSLGPLATPIGEIYRYTLKGPGADPMSLRTLQDWVVRPSLLRVQGVADVVCFGGLLREVHVEPDPARMTALGVELEEISAALRKASENATGGTVERGAEQLVIRSMGIFRTLQDIREVRVGFHAGVPVTLEDVAQVVVGYAPRQGVVTRGTDEDVVEGIVLMRRGQNPSLVLAALREEIDRINATGLPDEVRITPFYDRTELVASTMDTVYRNLMEGAGLVVLVLALFLMSLPAALVVAAVIPLSLLASFAWLQWRGLGANLLSMGSVDFGIIVDGAVILVEHLIHRCGAQAAPGPHGDASPHGGAVAGETLEQRVLKATGEVATPTLFSMLIIMVAYLPIFSLQRVEGRIFSPMAHTVVGALMGALLMSFTLVPVLMLGVLRRTTHWRESPLLRVSRAVFTPVLRTAMGMPGAVLVVALGTLVASGVLLPRLGSEFLPELNEGSLYVTFTLPGNMSLTQARVLTPRLRALLARTPEVAEMQSQLGRPEDGTDAVLANNLEFFVRLKPSAQWTSGKKDMSEVIAEMDRNLKEVPGVEYNFSQPIRDNVNENISGQFGQIAVKIYGEDSSVLQDVADRAKQALQDVPGVADLGIVKSGDVPQVEVALRRDALARFNLDVGDVQDWLETAMAGHVVGELWEGERRVDITVRLPGSTRQDGDTIRHLPLPVEGGIIPVSAVADVRMATGRAAITRENGQRYVGLRMNVRGRDLGGFVNDARKRLESAVALPAGYTVKWGGEFENKERAMNRLASMLPMALLITLFLLFSTFGRMWDAVVIMLNVPLALCGGVWGLALAGMPVSVSAAVGFIALLGQAVLNGVMVVSSIRARMAEGMEVMQASLEGTLERLRAVLMTALLASLGLLPAAFSHAMGAETQRPMAVVVVAGTVSAATLTLLVLPVVYAWAWRARMALTRQTGTPPLDHPTPNPS